MSSRQRFVAVLAAGFALAGAGAASAAPAATDPDVQQQIERVRQATVEYHDIAQAKADGYEAVSPCVDGRPTFDGAMGVHLLHHGLLEDERLDITKPEVLLYFPSGDGMRLVAVEWIKEDEDGDVTTDDDRPWLFDRPLHGPMPGHAPGEPVHYELHAWVWQGNPAGLFENWNPRLSCPDA